jgi:putative ABC transport system substrate-binding protein
LEYEVVALSPDVILVNCTATVDALIKATGAVPIVFANITDPVGSGLVASLARPGGNATGFASSELSLGGKLLELLKELAPRVTRVAVLRDSAIASQIGYLGGVQSVAASLGVEVRPIDLHHAGDIERAVKAFAREPNGGLLAVASAQSFLHRELIVTLADRYKLPAMYSGRIFVTGGGLASYSADTIQVYRQAAGYVDRILRGQKPADLPVQQSTKIELVINLKTAKSLGLTIPPTLLTLADKVIE